MTTNEASNVFYLQGDMLNSTMPAILQGCNTEGRMGAGVAKVLRDKYPAIYAPYAKACANGTFVPGSVLPIQVRRDKWVLNLASQDLPGKHARLEWIEEALDAAFAFCVETGLRGVSLPRIGSGLGGLKWENVKIVIERVAQRYPDITIEVWSL